MLHGLNRACERTLQSRQRRVPADVLARPKQPGQKAGVYALSYCRQEGGRCTPCDLSGNVVVAELAKAPNCVTLAKLLDAA